MTLKDVVENLIAALEEYGRHRVTRNCQSCGAGENHEHAWDCDIQEAIDDAKAYL